MSLASIPPDLLEVQKSIYDPCDLTFSSYVLESESKDYGACSFKLNHHNIKFRVAKITPTKTGQFVTLWKRIGKGPIAPYDLEDPFDFYIISVRTCENFGQFIFPKNTLCEKGIISKKSKGGKRAMRVYPPWDEANSPQAKKTQAWQSLYFFEVGSKVDLSNNCLQKLFL